MVTELEILVADEAWVALASLHQRYPERDSFSASEILESARSEKAYPEIRPGLQPHINLHNVGNRAPNSARYRMFYRTERGTYRLWRPGDDYHPDRKGKTVPRRQELPPEYHKLVDWYERDYCRKPADSSDDDDPVLQMWGVGKEIWKDEGGDAYVARERAEFDREAEPRVSDPTPRDTTQERVWTRILRHQGSEFHTATGLQFTYSIDGNGIWFYRNGRRIEQRLGRGEVDKAVALCPVSKTTELRKFRNYAYLFGLLIDTRIRPKDW